jgi:hypothetical protein
MPKDKAPHNQRKRPTCADENFLAPPVSETMTARAELVGHIAHVYYPDRQVMRSGYTFSGAEQKNTPTRHLVLAERRTLLIIR